MRERERVCATTAAAERGPAWVTPHSVCPTALAVTIAVVAEQRAPRRSVVRMTIAVTRRGGERRPRHTLPFVCVAPLARSYRITMREKDVVWMEAIVERACEKLFAACHTLEAAYAYFDVDHSGVIGTA